MVYFVHVCIAWSGRGIQFRLLTPTLPSKKIFPWTKSSIENFCLNAFFKGKVIINWEKKATDNENGFLKRSDNICCCAFYKKPLDSYNRDSGIALLPAADYNFKDGKSRCSILSYEAIPDSVVSLFSYSSVWVQKCSWAETKKCASFISSNTSMKLLFLALGESN